MFKVGDVVECLVDCEGQFTKGGKYTVRGVVGDTVKVERDDRGSPNGWTIKYFRLDEQRKPPVRTVTRREIVPGDYGRIRVRTERGVNIALLNQWNPWNAEELREAAHILNQLAEALEDKP